jgi:hypothetical protein
MQDVSFVRVLQELYYGHGCGQDFLENLLSEVPYFFADFYTTYGGCLESINYGVLAEQLEGSGVFVAVAAVKLFGAWVVVVGQPGHRGHRGIRCSWKAFYASEWKGLRSNDQWVQMKPRRAPARWSILKSG